jgi:hypothetical protein
MHFVFACMCAYARPPARTHALTHTWTHACTHEPRRAGVIVYIK